MQETQTKTAPVEGNQAAAPAADQATCCTNDRKPQSRGAQWLLAGGALAIGAGALYGGWDWLVASGTGAVLLGLAPCIAMCALGLCMGRGKK
jgi:hypothetical protein